MQHRWERGSRRVVDIILRGGDFGRPWVLPPGTPMARVKTLRNAYAKAMADTTLLDEAKIGYKTGTDIDLAVERGEVICRAFTITAFFAREPFFTWVKTNFVRILMQTGKTRDGRIKEVPTVHELMDKYKTDDAGRRLANLILAGGEFGRPYVLPPNTPADKVKIIREAFVKTIQDEAVIADAKKTNSK